MPKRGTRLILICLREYQHKGNTPITQRIDKIHINGLWCVPAVDQNKQTLKIFPLPDVGLDHIAPITTSLLRNRGITITR